MTQQSPFSDAPAPQMLPAAPDAERGLLCSLLIAPVEVGSLCAQRRVTADFFHIPAHREIWGVTADMIDRGQAVDTITVTQRLFDAGKLAEVGGAAFVSELSSYLPTPAHAEHYIDILDEKRTLRAMLDVCGEITRACYDDQDAVADILARFESRAIAVRRATAAKSRFTSRDVASIGLAEVQRIVELRGKISGLSTGLTGLDKASDGLHEGELIVIAARPSLGKTALAMQIAGHVAIEQGKRVAVFSLEMGRAQFSVRWLAGRAGVNMVPWRHGRHATEAEMGRLGHAAHEIAKAPMIFEDGSDMTITNLRASARGMAMREGVALIVVDSLSVLRSTSKQGRDNRHREVAECVNGCKEMAKELNVPVILIAHLGRGSDENAEPKLSDLRESGNIEQDADSVWMLWQPSAEDGGDTVEVFMPKVRNGERRQRVPLIFEKQFTRFREATDETAEQGEMI